MKLLEKMAALEKSNQAFVLATVVKTAGSVPGKVGFKMLIGENKNTAGTVGGGELEQRVVSESLARLQNGESGLQEYILQEKDAGKKQAGEAEVVPMMCNGKVWIYYEVNKTNPPVYIFGGGHVGHALSHLLSNLGYYIILVDNRKEFADEHANPYARERILDDYVHYAAQFNPPKDAYAVIMTQGHAFDYHILKALYERKLPLKYIGVIASHSKSAGLIKNLEKDLGTDLNLSNLYTPVGLAIGGNTEYEIALSIVSEIQAVRFGKKAPHMRDEITKG